MATVESHDGRLAVPRAIVFDFDGVIANSEPLHFRAFRDVLAQEGIVLTEADYYARYLGFDDLGAFAAVAADHDAGWTAARIAPLVARKALLMEALERDQSVLFPGAADAIRRLAASCPLAIASGAMRAEILRVLDREHLGHYFAAIVGAEDAAASKPAPDPYLRAVNLLADAKGHPLKPAECVAIEDSRWGLESAHAAGLRTVAVTHTYPAESLRVADKVVSGLHLITWELLGSFDL
jgi:HAD superfamily hydrolase (TIGR01509 family)